MLFTFSGYGQHYPLPVPAIDTMGFLRLVQPLYYFDDNTIFNDNPNDRCITLKDLIDYEKSCQKDSICINTYYYWDIIRFKKKSDTVIVIIEPTFKGFTKWFKQ